MSRQDINPNGWGPAERWSEGGGRTDGWDPAGLGREASTPERCHKTNLDLCGSAQDSARLFLVVYPNLAKGPNSDVTLGEDE